MPKETLLPNNYDEPANSRPELSSKPVDKRPILFGIVAALVVLVIFGGLGIWLFNYPEATAILRDIFIIFMGLGIFVIILLLIALVVITAYLVLKVNDLVQLLEREIKPILDKTQESLNTVRGTTTFLSDQAVRPVIKTAGTVAAVQTIARSLFKRK